MNAVQQGNTFDRSVHACSTYQNQSHRWSTLWIGDTAETPIKGLTVCETQAELILTLQIPEIDRLRLCVQITPEILRLKGQWKVEAGVEHFFHPPDFENLVPLPCPVHPETLWIAQRPEGLWIELAKQSAVERLQVCFDGAIAHSPVLQPFT